MRIFPTSGVNFQVNRNIKKTFSQSDSNVNNCNTQCEYTNIFNYSNSTNYCKNSIPFKGVTGKGLVKQRGMLLHITSLPATRSFCGQFGDIQTTKFII